MPLSVPLNIDVLDPRPALVGNWSPWVTDLKSWQGIAWSPKLEIFVAVAGGSVIDSVMTSRDGASWELQNAAVANDWLDVVWSPELEIFCAVADTGVGNRVMTSPDGVNWTARASALDADWRAITWSPEKMLFVAVANFSPGAYVMTSPDGIVWTAQPGALQSGWRGVDWSPELGLFCAVSDAGFAFVGFELVMTSPDGIVWTGQATPDNYYYDVAWAAGPGLFCISGADGGDHHMITSPDGVVWTKREIGNFDIDFVSICWSPFLERFCAVSDFHGFNDFNAVAISPDGVNWFLHPVPEDNEWEAVTYSPKYGIFCAVAGTGTSRAMTSLYYAGEDV